MTFYRNKESDDSWDKIKVWIQKNKMFHRLYSMD
jgi:hypothetical protein